MGIRADGVDDGTRPAHHPLRTIQNNNSEKAGRDRGRRHREEIAMEPMERRAFMKGAAAGALAFTVGGAEVMLTPRAARGVGVPLRTLTVDQAATLDALGETLVPGARQAGISHFVDQQISIPAEDALLEARILNVRPPYANFYRAALGAVDRASQALNGGRGFAQLNDCLLYTSRCV